MMPPNPGAAPAGRSRMAPDLARGAVTQPLDSARPRIPEGEPTTRRPVMGKSLFLGGVLGGIILFAWGAFSHMVLPFYKNAILKFTDEDAVAQTLAANAPRSGIYAYPMGSDPGPGATAEQKKAAEAAAWEKMKRGPFVFVAFTSRGLASLARPLTLEILTDILGALLVTWLVMQTGGLSYAGRWGFVMVAAFTAGVVEVIPNWNWWGFSGLYTLLEFVDLLAGAALAGLVIAKVGVKR
jgi:hypothetical protein